MANKHYFDNGIVQLHLGNAIDVIEKFQQESVQTVITSPPYFGLRDYGNSLQIGLEDSPEKYVQKLVDVFSKVKKILKSSGTLWINIGDSYYNYRPGKGQSLQKQSYTKSLQDLPQKYNPRRGNKLEGLKDKDLIGMPWRLAFALQKDGWFLRSDIIWHKPNPMPESVQDRPTKSHEYIFLFSKSQDYFYDNESIKEIGVMSELKNKQTVWKIKAQSFLENHFATYPEELIKPCVLAGTAPNDIVLDPFVGSGTTCVVSQKLNRKSIGIDLNKEYLNIARKRVEKTNLPLF
jgi:DNA modification methylase